MGYERWSRIEQTICIQKAPQEGKKGQVTAFPIYKEIENNHLVAGSFLVFIKNRHRRVAGQNEEHRLALWNVLTPAETRRDNQQRVYDGKGS